ncbi:MAG: acetolactate synthase small subunit [Christensenellales bacterium]
MKHIISVVVRNNSGVLARVSSLFGRRGFNIDSLSVSATDDPLISRITVVVNGDDNALEQVVKQTAKLVDTISVTALREENTVARELLLVKIIFTDDIDKNVVSLCDRFGAMILDITGVSMIIELTGTTYKIDEFMSELMNHAVTFRISKVCRTGITAMERGL